LSGELNREIERTTPIIQDKVEGLQKDAVSTQMEHGAEVLKATALHFHQHGSVDGGDNRLAVI
jgi:hypothetical protein